MHRMFRRKAGFSAAAVACLALLGCDKPVTEVQDSALTAPSPRPKVTRASFDFEAMVAQGKADDAEVIRKGLVPVAKGVIATSGGDRPIRKPGLWLLTTITRGNFGGQGGPGGRGGRGPNNNNFNNNNNNEERREVNTLCVTPESELRFTVFDQRGMPPGGPCENEKPRLVKTAEGWSLNATCERPMNNGNVMNMTQTQTLTGDLSKAYTMRMERRMDGNGPTRSQETIVEATLQGACPASQKGGDFGEPGNDRLINVLENNNNQRGGPGGRGPGGRGNNNNFNNFNNNNNNNFNNNRGPGGGRNNNNVNGPGGRNNNNFNGPGGGFGPGGGGGFGPGGPGGGQNNAMRVQMGGNGGPMVVQTEGGASVSAQMLERMASRAPEGTPIIVNGTQVGVVGPGGTIR